MRRSRRLQGWLAGPEAGGLGHAAVEEGLAERLQEFDAYWDYHLQREHERNHPPAFALAA